MKKILVIVSFLFVTHIAFAQDCPQTSPTYVNAQGQTITVMDNCTLSAPVKAPTVIPSPVVSHTLVSTVTVSPETQSVTSVNDLSDQIAIQDQSIKDINAKINTIKNEIGVMAVIALLLGIVIFATL